ncbi:MAG: TraG family conjugative transposon ATPase [Lachnospiraceae bacterium]|nr:TraG family conjugative transposon ATPase [Lachnospiraceae bacterium]
MNFNIKENRIEYCYPLLAYEDEKYLVSKSGDVTRLFVADMPQIYSSSNKELFGFHDAWCRAINCLPTYSIVHKQDIFSEGSYVDTTPDDSFLRKLSKQHFNGKKCLTHRCYIYVTLSNEKNFRSVASGNFILRNRLLPPEVINYERVDKFNDSVAQFCQILADSGFNLRELTSEEIIGTDKKFGLLDQYISLNFSGGEEYLRDLHTDQGDLKVGDDYVSCFSVGDLEDLPNAVSASVRNDMLSTDVSEVGNCLVSDICMGLPFNHIYNQYFFLDDNKRILADLEKDGKRMSSFSAISRENAINCEYNTEFLNEAHSTSKKIVLASFNVMTWDSSYKGLLEKNSQIGSALALIGCNPKKCEVIVPHLFWAGIPGAASNYPSSMKFLSFIPQACCFINFESNYKDLCGEDGNGLKLTDRKYGIPVLIDVSNEPMNRGLIDNKNKFVLGSSGSGKSFFTNTMVSQKYMSGDHIVIVDVGDSYQTLCSLINEESNGEDGVYYTYSEKKPISFNPFYVSDYEYPEEKVINLCTLIQVLWKNTDERFNSNETTQLRTCMQNYLDFVRENRNVFPCFNTFYEYLRDTYSKRVKEQNVRIENFDLDNMLQVLEPYYEGGTYDFLLNATDKLDLQLKRFVVFELDNIKDNPVIFPVVTLIIMDTFITKMRFLNSKVRKMILIEEAWKAISKAGMAEFIKYLYKTVRKHNGEVAVVTQEPDDLMDNPIVKDAIINSADVKILLDLSKFTNRFGKIMEALALSEKDAALALSVNKMTKPPYKEVFISFNGKFSSVYRVETSWGEALSFTSRKEEKGAIYDIQKKVGGSMRKAIIEYMKQKSK